MNSPELIATARGDAPSDLLLVNARVINTFTAGIEKNNVAICRGRIAGVGDYTDAVERIDLHGAFLSPGLIDGHVHLESSMLGPGEYARAVVPRGVLGVVTDFHEIANVCGEAGIEYILKYAEVLPMDIFGMAPSCVPATNLETSGARITVEKFKRIKALDKIIGLGEVMNYPGVISGDPDVLSKIDMFRGMVIDGHAPGISGKELNTYISTGIMSDHECSSLEEAEEKLNRGMVIMIREGSSERNLDALLPLVNDQTFKRCLFVVDDRNCADLLRDGDVDAVVRKAVKKGLEPVRAIQMATINPAEYFRLEGLGAIAPGYRANLMVLEDLADMEPSMVLYDGRIVAEKGECVVPIPEISSADLKHTVHIKPFQIEDLRIRDGGKTLPVIEIIPDQIITRRRDIKIMSEDGFVLPDVEKDLLKLVVVERHRATGNMGLGMVSGFGLTKGAFASTIAHDSHNIIAVGTNDKDIFIAIKELERIQGGLSISAEGEILGSLPLPIAGLLSEDPLRKIADKLADLHGITLKLGCPLTSPFVTLSFLALPVIPELRLTDMGMVDVNDFKLL
jgi:adenine deaminase